MTNQECNKGYFVPEMQYLIAMNIEISCFSKDKG